MGSVTGFVKVPVEQLLDQLGLGQSLVKDGCLRTLPGVGFQGDGFFAAVLERAGQSG